MKVGMGVDLPPVDLLPVEPDPPAWDIIVTARRVGRRTDRQLDRILSVRGLTFTQLEALHTLWDRPSSTPGMLARDLGMTRQSAYELLLKLAARGLAEMFAAEGGRRCSRLTLQGRQQLLSGSRWLSEVLATVEAIPGGHRGALLEGLARLEVAITAPRRKKWWLG